MQQRQAAINWVKAVFAGACLSGVMWAIVAWLTIYSTHPGDALTLKWVVLGAACLGLIVTGLAVARWARGENLRIAGVAMVIAPLTGGLLLAIGGGFGVLVLQ